MHHALHVAATGEADGYYADYCGDTEKLGRALAEGFSFQGEVMSYRGGPRGEPSAALPPLAFVSFIQNHDQIGNRAFGERLSAIAPAAAVRAAAAVYLLLPQVPMLFMGEEWAAPQPFLFFCDFGADARRCGARRTARRSSPASPSSGTRQSGNAFPTQWRKRRSCRPSSTGATSAREPHADWLAWYRRVLAIRKAEIVPLLARIDHGGRYEIVGEAAVSVRWSDRRRPRTRACRQPVRRSGRRDSRPPKGASCSAREPPRADGAFGPYSVRWSIRGSMDEMTEPPASPIPRATYRLQFRKAFGFDEAARLAPYLARLGISHVYASPYLMARPGSTHGYDIVDHDRLNPELGGDAAFARMVAALRQNGLGQIMDFVPNHMGVGGSDNPLWLDVLEWGPDSDHAGWFDIDWEPDSRYLHNKLLVPFLGDQYGLELERGHLRLKCDFDAGSFAVWAYDVHKLPICPLHYDRILGTRDPGPGAARRRLCRPARLAPADRAAGRRAEGGDGGAGRGRSRRCAPRSRRRWHVSTARPAISTAGSACMR